MNDAVNLVREHFDELVLESAKVLLTHRDSKYSDNTVEEMRPRISAGYAEVLRDLEEPGATPPHFGMFWARIVNTRMRQGYNVTDLLLSIAITERTLRSFCRRFIQDPDVRLSVVERMSEVCENAREVLFETFTRVHREIIREQESLVRLLSTPLLPLYTGVLVLPLIGTIDAQRAEQIMQQLLLGIVQHRASAVILDVTGMPQIDKEVAEHFLRVAQAARLLGASIVLAGINADIARTMVGQGIHFAGITTCATLQAAVLHALDQLGLSIRPRMQLRAGQ